MPTIYYDTDADPKSLQGKTIAVIGYGSQGHAHALNLRDSGQKVVVGLPAASRSRAKAEADGFTVREVREAARTAELHARLKAWRESVGARLPTPNPDHNPEKDKPAPKKK